MSSPNRRTVLPKPLKPEVFLGTMQDLGLEIGRPILDREWGGYIEQAVAKLGLDFLKPAAIGRIASLTLVSEGELKRLLEYSDWREYSSFYERLVGPEKAKKILNGYLPPLDQSVDVLVGEVDTYHDVSGIAYLGLRLEGADFKSERQRTVEELAERIGSIATLPDRFPMVHLTAFTDPKHRNRITKERKLELKKQLPLYTQLGGVAATLLSPVK